MNREIKFKVWDNKNKEFIPPENIIIRGDSPIFDREIDEELHDVELMQYTGLKDQNGKEIYEGDIVSNAFSDKNEKGVVEWDEGDCIFMMGVITLGYANREGMIGRVIGNIYNNPELLI